MKYYIFIILLIISTISNVFSQNIVSGRSEVMDFEMKIDFKKSLPPDLKVELKYDDDNENGLLEPAENSILYLTITNNGYGPAQGVSVKINDLNPEKGLIIDQPQVISKIIENQKISLEIPIYATNKVKTNEHKLEIQIAEHFGFDMEPAYLILNTLEYQNPEIKLSGYKIIDTGNGVFAINADEKIQPGEMVIVQAFLQNSGYLSIKNIDYNVITQDSNIYLENNTGNLSILGPGEMKSIHFKVNPNKRTETLEKLPLSIILQMDGYNERINKNVELPLALNKSGSEPQTYVVKADIENILKRVARFEYNTDHFTANFEEVVDISKVEQGTIDRPKSVAVIFGIENYKELPPAPYAENDAKIIEEYFKKRLGIEQIVIFKSDEADGFIFDDIFNSEYGELKKAIIPDETELFVFYSGHGIPSNSGEQVFLFPSDGRIARLETQGYELNQFYENLSKLKAKSTTVFIDACFSGSSRFSQTIQQENLIATKGILIKPKIIKPWELYPGFSVFASSSAGEVSLAFDASKTGLFTYYLCLGMKGKADLNNDHSITLGELKEFVISKVQRTSAKIRGTQSPIFYGNDDYIVITY